MATRVGGGSKGSKNFGQRSLASERTASARFLKQLGRVEAQRVGSSGRHPSGNTKVRWRWIPAPRSEEGNLFLGVAFWPHL